MESTRSKTITICQKISLLSILVPYYGYIHECAELLLQLDKKTREIWLQNLKPFLGVIMDFKKCTLVKEINGILTKENVENLLTSNHHLYFSLKINLKSEQSYQAIVYLINHMEIHLKDQFDFVDVELGKKSSSACSLFLQKYLEKGFDCDAVCFDFVSFDDLVKDYCEENSVQSEDASVGLDLMHSYDSLKNLSITGDSLEEEKEELSLAENIQKVLESNYKFISISAQALIYAYQRKADFQFEHSLCKEILINLEFSDFSLRNPEYLEMAKGLEVVLRHMPRIETIDFHGSLMLENLISRCFSDKYGAFDKIQNVRKYRFYNSCSDEATRLELSMKNAEIIYIHPDTNQLHLYTVDKLKIKLFSEDFKLLEESKIFKNSEENKEESSRSEKEAQMYLQISADFNLIKLINIKLCNDKEKKDLYIEKILKSDRKLFDFKNLPPMIFKFSMKYPILKCQK